MSLAWQQETSSLECTHSVHVVSHVSHVQNSVYTTSLHFLLYARKRLRIVVSEVSKHSEPGRNKPVNERELYLSWGYGSMGNTVCHAGGNFSIGDRQTTRRKNRCYIPIAGGKNEGRQVQTKQCVAFLKLKRQNWPGAPVGVTSRHFESEQWTPPLWTSNVIRCKRNIEELEKENGYIDNWVASHNAGQMREWEKVFIEDIALLLPDRFLELREFSTLTLGRRRDSL